MLKKILLLILLVCTLPSVFSWGISFEKTSFVIPKGGYQDVRITLQNYVGADPAKITLNVTGDNEIAEVTPIKEYHWLQPKTRAYDLNLRITIPDNAKDEYFFNLEFTNEPLKSGIGIATRKTVHIHVIVPDGEIVEVIPPPIEESDNKINDEDAEKELEKYKDSITGEAVGVVVGEKKTRFYLGVILPLLLFLVLLIFILKKKNKEKEYRDML